MAIDWKDYRVRGLYDEIMRGAPVMEGFLGTTLKEWLDERVRIIETWIEEGKIAPIDPKTLLYMIWATTQHYADFQRQMVILNDGVAFDERQFAHKVEQVVSLILRSVGLDGEANT